MYKLGITGGIASGKSTAASYLKNKNKNSYIFNADRESKKHLKSSHSLQQKIINVFGNKIVRDNKLDLKLLAQNAFSNTKITNKKKPVSGSMKAPTVSVSSKAPTVSGSMKAQQIHKYYRIVNLLINVDLNNSIMKLVHIDEKSKLQINGKTKDVVELDETKNKEEIIKILEKNEKISRALKGKTINKTIYVPSKIINYVVS